MNISKEEPNHPPEPRQESLKRARHLLQLGLSPDEQDRALALKTWKEHFAEIIDYGKLSPDDCSRIFVSGFVRGLRHARGASK